MNNLSQRLNIAIVGLGLIGGSLCKAISRFTDHTCYAIDIDPDTINSAVDSGIIRRGITPEELCRINLTIVCLHPKDTINFILDNKDHFKKNSIVIDVCGVKEAVVSAVSEPLSKRSVNFVGTHPMAGREFSGFSYSTDNLFDNASFIITKTPATNPIAISFLSDFAKALSFKSVVITTPAEHDRIIAFTSQMAHIVSNAYVKSPMLYKYKGFSAGSFVDLTRVAALNESMWTELFMFNRKAILEELDNIITHLTEYRDAISDSDADKLKKLLKDGSDLKKSSSPENI